MKSLKVVKLLTRVLVGAAALSTLFVFATPAQAGSYDWWAVETKAADGFAQGAGLAHFDAYGEHLYVYDNDADGYGPAAFLLIDGKYYGPFYDKKGYNTHEPYDLSFAENLKGKLWVCMMNGNKEFLDTCSTRVDIHT
ncbi:hypothetical protein [Nocardia araoensis]|uniref:hypothetical protein n=1 Tax=Nocardia araoensis TaxID=228600 RepID=UPI000585C1F1|nr:hypothetical protein [Nocardia araoensis]